jgi:hypothetical protein
MHPAHQPPAPLGAGILFSAPKLTLEPAFKISSSLPNNLKAEVTKMNEKELLAQLNSLRQRAREVFERELACYDEDRIQGGDPAVYRAACERVWRELGAEILQLLLPD